MGIPLVSNLLILTEWFLLFQFCFGLLHLLQFLLQDQRFLLIGSLVLLLRISL
jgi:hypothetical protein